MNRMFALEMCTCEGLMVQALLRQEKENEKREKGGDRSAVTLGL